MSVADRVARGVVVVGFVMVVMLLLAITSEVRRTRIVLERAWPSNEQIESIESAYQKGYRDAKEGR